MKDRPREWRPGELCSGLGRVDATTAMSATIIENGRPALGGDSARRVDGLDHNNLLLVGKRLVGRPARFDLRVGPLPGHDSARVRFGWAISASRAGRDAGCAVG